jgi:arylsulfatase
MSTSPKHVIWITADHLRYDCIAAHSNPAMHTPNLDRLVEQGVSFDHCYAQNPVCMPSRCSFMTGLYPQQTGVTANGICLPPDFRPTVAHAFSAGGYQTAQIGKLHFQPHEDNDLDPRPRHDYGFDVLWLAEEPGCYDDAYLIWLRSEYPQHVDDFRVPRSTSPQRWIDEKRVIDAPWEASFSGWIVQQAERYLQDRGGRHFVHLGFYAPHHPLNPTAEMFAPYADADLPLPEWPAEEWADKPEPLASLLQRFTDWDQARFLSYRRHFYAMVTGVDLAIGRLMDYLEHRGELDDTLIVFNGDHGDMCGDHHLIGKHFSFFEEIMRMPCVLHWPAGLGTTGRRVEGLVELVDLLPTLLELSGCPVPEVMMGRSYAAELWTGRPLSTREDVMAYHEPGFAMLRSERYKYIRYGPGREVLYKLDERPLEVANHADDNTDALHEMRERLMQRLLEAGRSRLPRIYLW